MFPARRNVFRKYSRQSHFITRQVLWKEEQKLQQSPYCQCFRTHRIWTSLWVDTFIVTEFRAQRPCVITHVSAFWLQCLRSECHVYESRSVICLQGGWLATGRVSRIPPPLLSSPSPPLPLLSCRDIFQLWSLNRKARSIRIDCPWRAAPLSSQCQPVCDREGEKWRKISAALAVSFPHTWVGRLPADRTVEKGGLDSGAEGKEAQPGMRLIYVSVISAQPLCSK